MMKCKTNFMIIFVLALLVLIELTITTCTRNEEDSYTLSAMSSYKIVGKDMRASYQGIINIYADEDSPGSITAFRQIQYNDSKPLRFTGVGTLRNGRIELRFGNLASPIQSENMRAKMTPSFKPAKTMASHIIGSFDREFKKAKVFYRLIDKNKIVHGEEEWTLDRRKELWERHARKVKIKRDEWVSVPISMKKPGVVKISTPGAVAPRGSFFRKGEKIPDIEKIEEYDVILPVNPMTKQSYAMPNAYTEKDGATWLKSFNEEDVKADWVFWFRDEARVAAVELEFFITYIDIAADPIPLPCDPWVNIDVSPNIVAVGEPITITVDSRAFAGIDMFWWFGSGTGITELDKAHIMSGSGLVTGSYTWNITIDEPGAYTFGANTRDLLYWTDLGVPHQASEGCGLAYDTVVVQRGIRKSYNVAFILFAPEGTDITSTEFQGHLNKLDDIKTAFITQFVTSTEAMGVVDASYPTVVLTPPGPVYGIGDDMMWTFLCESIANYFYMDHPDIFDFLAIYEVYPDKTIGSRHRTVQTKVAGFGITPYNISASWGSAGKLRGVGLVTDVNELPETYDFSGSKMHLLLHEVFGHQWGVFANRLGWIHFDIGIESPNFTVLYGRPWRKIDETHFTTENVQDPATGTFKVTFHPWILYVSGMRTRSEIPEVLMDVEPDTPPTSRYDIVTTTGTYENVTLQSVIDESGDRRDVVW